jgi:retron-type reverse transcriptase
MKRHGHLWERVCDLDNLWVAYRNARKGKVRYRQISEFDPVADQFIPKLRDVLVAGEFRTSPYKVFSLVERGKPRTIHALPFYPDRIVHHAITQVCAPIWERSLIRNTFAALPGRGIHDGVRRVARITLHSESLYVLKLDVKQFYPSVDHAVLKGLIRRQLKDAKLLTVLDEIIDSGPGLPIGNYLSQYFGNIFLSPVDHRVTSGLGFKHYFRYCDDIVVLHADKKKLQWLKGVIADELAKLRLELKSNWQVFPLAARGLDFIGYRFWPSHILVRKKTIVRLRRRLKTKRPTLNEAARVNHAARSFKGWLRYADTVKLQRVVVQPALGKVDAYVCRFRTSQAIDHNLPRRLPRTRRTAAG